MSVAVRAGFPDFLGVDAKPFRKRKRMAKKLTSAKAREILSHGEVHGEPLSKKQKKFFGAVAGGQKPRKRNTMHNPHEPYGDNASKAESNTTPRYSARGKLGKLQ